MKRFAKIPLFALLLVFVLSHVAYAHVYLKGSDVAQFFPRLAAESYEMSNDVSVISIKKNEAIKLLATDPDSCDIALSTWPLEALDDEEVLNAIAAAEAQGIEFSQTPFVVDAIPPIVHKDNPVKGITLKQLHEIYTGKITKWSEIDATINQDVLIEVYTTGDTDSKYIIWKEIVIQGPSSDDIGIPGPKDISSTIASDDHKWAIGFDSMYYIKASEQFANDEIRILGITNPEELKAGPSKEYPVSRYLYMITRSDISDDALAFAAYLLMPDTQQLAYNVSQLPLPEEEGMAVNHSDSSTCNAGFGALAFLALAPLCFVRKK